MPIFDTAFRAFFLAASLLAAVWIPAWVYLVNSARELSTPFGAMGWHAHEMVFGYGGAVLAGFLLTAARNWTKRPTLSGMPLAALVAVWIFGRVAVLKTTALPEHVPAIADGLFFTVLAAAIAIPIAGARSRRNIAFPILIVIIGACDVLTHLHVVGKLGPWSSRAFIAAIDATALIIFIFGGRIVPMFTKNATGAVVRSRGLLDWCGLGALAAYGVARAIRPDHDATHVVGIAAGVLNAARLYGWGGLGALGKPILWVLHLGWLLLAAGIALSGLNGLLLFAPPSTFLHLLTIGGLGIVTLGMMARVSLGHTGRPLVVPRLVALGFALLVGAAGARIAAQVSSPADFRTLLWVAAACWSAAFVAFATYYTPILLMPRADGKPG